VIHITPPSKTRGTTSEVEAMFALIILLVLIILAIYTSAKESMHATFIPEGMIKFLVKGGTMVEIVPNISGRHYNTKNRKIEKTVSPTTNSQGFLADQFGIFFRVRSLMYPIVRWHKFTIDASRLVVESKRKGKPFTQWIESASQEVEGLRWRFHQPFLFENIELKDGYTVNILVFALFEVVNPYLPVFIYRGKFFEQLSAAIQGKMSEYLNNSTYTEFIKLDKGQGGGFTPELIKLNDRTTAVPKGIEALLGIRCIDGWVVEFGLSGASAKQKEAIVAKETERLLGEGVKVKASAEAEAIETLTKAQSDRFDRLLSAMVAKGVTPDEAARSVAAKIVSENLRDSKITTLAGGNALLGIAGNKS